jgi:hypothetical protein
MNAHTRTLVGPLSANACRLMDEHHKPGIFFLFQDLSVRTEGLSFSNISGTVFYTQTSHLNCRNIQAKDASHERWSVSIFPFVFNFQYLGSHSSPALEMGVHNDVSPVLAQAFTDPFTVFSAKRFPGVPGISIGKYLICCCPNINPLHFLDSTALSIALGNQGQKLPLVGCHVDPARWRY